jgi:hypothetical protein
LLAILGPPVPNHKDGPIQRGRIKDAHNYYENDFALAFVRWPTALAIQNIFLDKPANPSNPYEIQIFRFDGNEVSLLTSDVATTTELTPDAREKLLALFQHDACVNEQRQTNTRDGTIYFISRTPDATKGIAFFGNPLRWHERKRGATCFHGEPGPPPLAQAPTP